MARRLRRGFSLHRSPGWTRKRSFLSENSKQRPVLLWIDDFAPALMVYKATMEELGFRVLTASNGQAGLELAALHTIDLVVTDYEMPGMNGEIVAAAMKALKPAIPVIIFSGSTVISHRAQRYADAFCDKAGSRDRLLGTIHRLLHGKHGRMKQTHPPLRASHQARRTIA